MAVVFPGYVQSLVMPVFIPCGPGDPGTPGGPGEPSLPGGPGGPWPLDAKMPAGVFWSVLELNILSAESGKKSIGGEFRTDCRFKANGTRFIPSKILKTSFLMNILSSSTKPGSSCLWQQGANDQFLQNALPQLSKEQAKTNKKLPHYITYNSIFVFRCSVINPSNVPGWHLSKYTWLKMSGCTSNSGYKKSFGIMTYKWALRLCPECSATGVTALGRLRFSAVHTVEKATLRHLSILTWAYEPLRSHIRCDVVYVC